MTVGVCFYGVAPGQSSTALALGLDLFEKLGLRVTSATTPRLLARGDHPGDHEVANIDLAELSHQIQSGSVAAFAIFNEDGAHLPWHAAFHHSIDGFGSFPHVSIQVPDSIIGLSDQWAFQLSPILNKLKFEYAIGYHADKASSAWNYCSGGGTQKVDPRENAIRFAREIPETRGGQGRYSGSMLRMVYPLNVLSPKHCAIMVDGVRLDHLIRSSYDLGAISELANDMTLWIVPETQLAEANAKLGSAGCLISWQDSRSEKPRRIP